MGSLTILLFMVQFCTSIPIDEPSKWPGHLESFGSKQVKVDIDIHYEWPSPKDFFKQFVDKTRPGLFRGVNKHSPAIHLWDDAYFTEHESSEDITVHVEGNKENRSAIHRTMSFVKFINSYHKKPLLIFNSIPTHLKKDIEMPSPLTCNETRKHLVNAMWFMSGGESKSVVCNEDVETILCPIKGTAQVLLIEYTQNKNYVIDRPEGGYSTLDVDRVDYVKYPNLRKVDQYIYANVEEGDCLYIPYRWYRQMNGHANNVGHNIALNLWFKHLHGHAPSNCENLHARQTLDMFQYDDLKRQGILPQHEDRDEKDVDKEDGEDKEDGGDSEDASRSDYLLKHFYSYFKIMKSKNVTFQEFFEVLKKDETLTNQDHQDLKFPATFKTLAIELYTRLDLNNDTRLTNIDFKKIVKNLTMRDTTSKYLEYQAARIEDYVEDLVEAKHHDEPLHKFEERMKEKFRSERKFDEL